MEWKVPLFKTYHDESDVNAVKDVINRGTYWATGPEIEEFEDRVASYVGSEHALAMNSGTSALLAALLAEEVAGKEVIIPSFSFVATANSVLLADAEPVFADIEEESYGLDAKSVEEKINEDTAAIMPMHYGGRTSRDIAELKDIADDNDITLIEDAAESLGSHRENHKAGTVGKMGVYSLCQNKVISTGEGGVVVTDSDELFEKLRLIRSHGRVNEQGGEYFSRTEDTDYIRPGYNFRMPTMCAALGNAQMEKIDKNIGQRQKIASRLNDGLEDLEQVSTPPNPDDQRMVYQMYTIEAEDRDGLKEYLTDNGVMCKTYWATPIHQKSLYQDHDTYLPRTEALCERVLTLPMFPDMTDKQINTVIETVKSYYG